LFFACEDQKEFIRRLDRVKNAGHTPVAANSFYKLIREASSSFKSTMVGEKNIGSSYDGAASAHSRERVIPWGARRRLDTGSPSLSSSIDTQ
jgi:hypothetical protein